MSGPEGLATMPTRSSLWWLCPMTVFGFVDSFWTSTFKRGKKFEYPFEHEETDYE